ncbi:MAG: 4Fe-4S binding protein [Gemmatimonadetes bacterium]|nr:4Fe-4S binding protein [Gemmatimonadota bacterium]
MSATAFIVAAGREARRSRVALLAALALVAGISLTSAPRLCAQSVSGIPLDLLWQAMPQAARFAEKQGDPPVMRAFAPDAATGKEALVGYVFVTSDLPPEIPGYTAPIEVLAGMDLQGKLTGAVIIRYIESLQNSRGDFLRRPGFQEQFAGKHLADPFTVRRDVDGISGATISVAAMSRGIRNAARRVAAAYLVRRATGAAPVWAGTVSVEELGQLSWADMLVRGLAQQILATDERGETMMEISLAYLRNDSVGEAVLGPKLYADAIAKAGARAQEDHHLLLGLDGAYAALFAARTLKLVQGTDTLVFVDNDAVMAGTPTEGKLRDQVWRVGLLLVDSAVDMRRPFQITFQRQDLGPVTLEYAGEPRVVAAAPARAPREPAARDSTAAAAAAAPANGSTAAAQPAVSPASASAAGAGAAGTPGGTETLADVAPTDSALAQLEPMIDAADALGFAEAEDESVLARTLAQTSWARVGLLLVLLALVTAAFVAKERAALRWAVLTATFLYLGFGGGGFLSVSHITSAISVGPGVFLTDIPLLLLVSFTVVTLLFWGRVFCGFLCPFGALQDFLERVVPKRFRRHLPQPIHERALLVKYGVLALVVIPVAAGIHVSLFQYFEPFGTVFFLSPSVLLWAIAIGILGAAAIVPRFYCRYMCPLGAALALGSLLSPFRIRRVDACSVCKVCEHHCPTGAIRGPDIDFKECVRCNICEAKLSERAGVCKHDWEEVRYRLVLLKDHRARQRLGVADAR